MKYCSERDYLPLKEFLEEYETCLEDYPVSIKITRPNLMYIPGEEERKRLRKMHILIDIGMAIRNIIIPATNAVIQS